MPAEIDPAGILSSPGKSETLQDWSADARLWAGNWPNFVRWAISHRSVPRSGCRPIGRHRRSVC